MLWRWCGSSGRRKLTTRMWCSSQAAQFSNATKSCSPQTPSLDSSPGATTAATSPRRQQMALRQILCWCPALLVCISSLTCSLYAVSSSKIKEFTYRAKELNNSETALVSLFQIFILLNWIFFPPCTLTVPETVQPSVSSQGSNSSLLVSWSKPPGNVAYYTVHINSTTTVDERVISPTNASFLFENLSPGIIYSARVTTNSGFSNASSGFVSNATCKSDAFVRC